MQSTDNPDSLYGPSYAFLCINEPALMSEEIMKAAVSRVRGTEHRHKQINFAGTWENVPVNWFYKKFWESPPPEKDFKLYRASSWENINNVGIQYIRNLLQNYDAKMVKQYVDGFPTNLGTSMIYYAFQSDMATNKSHIDPGVKYIGYLPLGFAFDFNVDPMTCTIVQWVKDGKVYAIDEVVQRNSNTPQLCQILKKWLRDNVQDHKSKEINIFGDATGKARSTQSLKSNYQIISEEFKDYHIVQQVPMNNPPLSTRFNTVNRHLSGVNNFQVRISPRCKNLINDYQGRVYKSGDVVPDRAFEIKNRIGHSADNFDYFLCEMFPLFRGKYS